MNTVADDIYLSKENKITRNAYIWECAFEYFISLLISDAYLSSLLSYMNISDGMIGVITALISFSFIFQLLSLVAVKKIVRVKRTVTVIHFASQLFFTTMFFLPFLSASTEMKTGLVIICTVFGYLGSRMVTALIFKWGMTSVDPHKRASYSATKEMVSLVSGTAVMLLSGYAVDLFAAKGNIEGGFIFLAVVIFAFNLLDLICLLLMKNPKGNTENTDKEPILKVVVSLFKNKAFLSITVITVLYFSAMYLTNSFMGIYKIAKEDLGFTVGEAQVINIVGMLFRFAISKPIGRFSDKTSYSTGFLVGAVMFSVCFFLNIFTSPSARWMIWVYTLLFNGAQAAMQQNVVNITFDYVKEEEFVQATSIKSAIAGGVGFLTSILGGWIVDAVQASGNSFMGIEVRGQQILSAISCILSVMLVLFMIFVMKKQKRVDEE
ncbi:MAG: MFS transporter [Clostridia bacterium]|nr:MFS transporter [Clostridia bacterium]